MPFKGTDKDAYRKAAKGRTKQEKSTIYYDEKRKNEQQKNRNNNPISKFLKAITNKVKPTKKTYDIPTTKTNNIDRTKRTSVNRSHKQTNTKNIVKENQLSVFSDNIENQNKKFFKKVLTQFGNEIKEQIIDLTLNYIKQIGSEEVQNAIQTFQTIQEYFLIAQNIYKVVIKIYNSFDKINIKYKKLNKNVEPNNEHNLLAKTKMYSLEEWHFGEDKETSDKLFNLVNQGVKTATSSLYDNKSIGKNKYSILTNWDKTKKLLIQDTNMYESKFGDITEDFANKEGEDDKSLISWKKIHQDYFSKQLEEKGLILSDDTKILCEEFKKIKKLP